jgi:hypothetical protein
MTCATLPLDGVTGGGGAAPLATELAETEVFAGVVIAAGLSVRLAGLAVRFDEETITGSAGALGDEGDPMDRARFELEERLALLRAMKTSEATLPLFDRHRRSLGSIRREEAFPQTHDEATLRWSRSSGVAAGTSFEDAACRARYELVERDRILRSWYGDLLPSRILDMDAVPDALHAFYRVETYAFPEDGSDVSVAAVFAFPRATGPLVFGFGARPTEAEAVGVAARELVQRLGFLWEEALPDRAPSPSPTADFHQDHYLFPDHHAALRRWLDGEHAPLGGSLRSTRSTEPTYLDLSPAGGPVVVKAVPCGHVPLAFGVGHPLLERAVPGGVAVHPIA